MRIWVPTSTDQLKCPHFNTFSALRTPPATINAPVVSPAPPVWRWRASQRVFFLPDPCKALLLLSILFNLSDSSLWLFHQPLPSSAHPLQPIVQPSITSACSSVLIRRGGFPIYTAKKLLQVTSAVGAEQHQSGKSQEEALSVAPGALMRCYETEGPLLVLHLHT